MYVLSEEIPFQALAANGSPAAPDAVKWRNVAHTLPSRLALVIWAGNKFVSPEFSVARGEEVHLEIGTGLPKISADGLDVTLRFRSNSEVAVLFAENLPSAREGEPWRRLVVPMDEHTGQTGVLEIECGPGPQQDPTADWLAITECLICPPDQVSLGRARMNRRKRSETEIKHFTNAYKMPMFQSKAKVNAFSLAQQIVQGGVLEKPVNFSQRLREQARRGPLRIASLCCGAGRTERKLVDGIEDRISITLVDINQELLDRASASLALTERVDTICADINEFELPHGEYDIIMCVSALHHVIELEHVVDEISKGLVEGGEFWSIGEYVGRTGARLWPESYRAADDIFSELPARYRRNHAAGDGLVDEHLRNVNCALNTFEGVRSEDIMPVLESRLEPEIVDRWSTIIWRVLGPAYVSNYDVEQPEDRALVEEIARRDIQFQQRGQLRPVAMKGVFRRR